MKRKSHRSQPVAFSNNKNKLCCIFWLRLYRSYGKHLFSYPYVAVTGIGINVECHIKFTQRLVGFFVERHHEGVTTSNHGIPFFIKIIRQTLVENIAVSGNVGFHLNQRTDFPAGTQFLEFDFRVDEIVVAG